MRFQSCPTSSPLSSDTTVLQANFKVKNDGHVTLIITHGHIPLPPVVVPPGKTSPPFTNPDTYTIVPELVNPLPEPAKIVVTFSPKKEIIAKSFGNQPVDAEIIAKFD